MARILHSFSVLLMTTVTAFVAPSTFAQENNDTLTGVMANNPDEPLLLEAETLTYDTKRDIIAVAGDVQIFYQGNALEADRVEYRRSDKKLIAQGNVRLTERGGNVVRTNALELSEDFSEGFSESLQLDTLEQASFAAASATRSGGKTTLTNGIYDVCAACQSHPGRPPLWRIKAQKIIIDDETRSIRYENPRFELFGVPVAWLPYFSHPDPSIKQKSGLLIPRFFSNANTGLGVSVPYYHMIDANSDVTIAPRAYSKQGVLADIEWRRRSKNGAYSLQMAGIHQESPEEFNNTSGNTEDRGGLRTKGSFNLNSRWEAGWDILALSDRTFAEDYKILTSQVDSFKSNIHLTGLGTRNYFDARGLFFNILDDDTDTSGNLQDQQAIVHPVIDYDGILNQQIFGGQLSYATNFTSLSRVEAETVTINGDRFINGIERSQARATTEVEWKRSWIAPGGQVITPILAAQGTAFSYNTQSDFIDEFPDSDILFRGMVTAGLEWRWPLLIEAGNSNHFVEPIAQIFVRPDEGDASNLPNEDAQNLLLDGSNLFERDKFSGYDRVEGGTRANIGLQYQGQIGSALSVNGLIGQSYHISGKNSFDETGLASVYQQSGLEGDSSDIIMEAGATVLDFYSLNARTRVSDKNLAVNRADIIAAIQTDTMQAGLGYSLIREQELDDLEQSEQINANLSVAVHENLVLFGDTRYDLNDNDFINNRIGFRYVDEYIALSLAFRQENDEEGDGDNNGVEFNVSFRTLGGF